jgi:hypothetical protein
MYSRHKQTKTSLKKKTKNGEQESKTGSVWGDGTSGRGDAEGEGMVPKLCTHICKWKK